MGVEEFIAVGLERAHGFGRRQGQFRLPSVDDDQPATAVDGHNHARRADGAGQFLREVEVGLAVLENRRPDDDLLRAGGEDLPGALDGPDAAADAARQLSGDDPDERQVVARSHRRVEIDDLDLRKRRETAHPAKHVVVPDGEPLALDQLDHGAALEVDGWNQHRACDRVSRHDNTKTREHEDTSSCVSCLRG